MAIRVYELSKKLGITNKELLELLKEHGFALSTVAAVPAEAEALAEKVVAQRDGTLCKPAPEEKVEEKKAPLQSLAEPAVAPLPSIGVQSHQNRSKPSCSRLGLELLSIL